MIALLLEWWRGAGDRVRRRVCAREGHVWAENRRGAPVTEFEYCVRCGKVGGAPVNCGAGAR